MFDNHPDTCDGYVSDGPFCCICEACVRESAHWNPPREERPCPYRFTGLFDVECWSGNCSLASLELNLAIHYRRAPVKVDLDLSQPPQSR